MSLLDRIPRRTLAAPSPAAEPAPAGKRPKPRTGATRSESGRGQRQGLLSYDDHNLDLVGQRGAMEMDRIWRSDADARKAILMVVNALCGGTITIEPAGGENATDEDMKVAEFVRWALFEEMSPRLPSHLYTALTVTCRNGRVPFEDTYRLTKWEGRDVFVLDSLGIILPRSITYWHAKHRKLERITQMTSYDGMVDIPAEDLVLYRLGAEGDNWEGESLLRAAYANVGYIADLELIDAQGHERFNMGIPIAYPPQDADEDDLDEVEIVLKNLRAGAESYIVAPGPHQEHAGEGGWLFDILVPKSTSGGRSVVESINHHRSRISASVIEEFMRLGQQGEGARATADVQQDPFLSFGEVLAGLLIEDPWNEQMIPKLVDLNFNVEKYPRLSVSLIDSTSLGELASFAQTLSSAGLLHGDDKLEDYFRDRADLPAADPDERARRKEQEDVQAQREQETHEAALQDPTADPRQEKNPSKRMTLRADRPLKAWEARISLDRIESAIDTARDRFVDAVREPARLLAASLAAADNPTDPGIDTGLLDAVHRALRALYDLGYQTVVEELDAQAGPRVLTLNVERPDDQELRMRSEIATANITARMLTELRRANTRPLVRDATAQAALQQAAEAGARAAAREEATQNASTAVNLGRRSAAEQNAKRIRGARYTSILDSRRCRSCAAADDDVLRPLDDPVRLSRMPPNPFCEGKGACRCLEFFELLDEADDAPDIPVAGPRLVQHLDRHPLPADPDAVRSYTRKEIGIPLNQRLRQDAATDEDLELAARLDESMSRLGVHAIAYRGLADASFLLGPQGRLGVKDRGYLSTSTDGTLAEQFATGPNPALVQFVVPADAVLAWAAAVSVVPDEMELLLPRGAILRVADRLDRDGRPPILIVEVFFP